MEKGIVTIKGTDIESLINLFNDRGTNFYHACQFSAFDTYLKGSAVVTPAGLVEPGAGTERGWTDTRIHLCPIDQSQAYAQDTANLPNPRGPISLQFLPAALRRATEVGICLRAVDADDALIGEETFLELKDVEYLFRYTAEAPLPEKTHLKSAAALKEEFGVENASFPELFCRFADNRLPLKFVNKILVDHYMLYNRELRDWVFEAQHRRGTGFLIERRYCPADIGGHLLKSVARILQEGVPSLLELAGHSNQQIRQWARILLDKDLGDRWARYAPALRRETLLPLKPVSERYFSRLRDPSVKNMQTTPPISAQTRQLIQKLLAEDIPTESIARIVDIPLDKLTLYIRQSGRR